MEGLLGLVPGLSVTPCAIGAIGGVESRCGLLDDGCGNSGHVSRAGLSSLAGLPA